MSTFKILEVNNDGTVKVQYSCDNKVQTLASMPVDNQDALLSRLNDYGFAYEAGLEMEAKAKAAVEVPEEVKFVVGVEYEVIEPKKPEPVEENVSDILASIPVDDTVDALVDEAVITE